MESKVKFFQYLLLLCHLINMLQSWKMNIGLPFLLNLIALEWLNWNRFHDGIQLRFAMPFSLIVMVINFW